ncbi:hypothetical protein NEUTE1DRAFT_135798 [Neurospora tetrasperma FGSC 2508]|uniref:Uncharacterized protein n=1 Tax=Neurospora tetrasperma (strain FGSC 2508 / ATCC MYA-4615 / P0657) TaxID=510951 RepID=F8MGX8_NEUT8|nr:uncharacterized protein NEUTE1DRAFT_135798 [Neurospora tetrasperma FGSC 2508]EGO58697.1 hypothetical protein NEUTE1DRAFT_135798 [Neurospora tetrasperma FGSC 2508]EGZ72784.1 hypothetical protein NEUTE2DRAFT_164987 [Neurospora tetrasperma FGSC 2509]
MSGKENATTSKDQPNEQGYVPHKPFTPEFVKINDEEDEAWRKTKHKLEEVHQQAMKVFVTFTEELITYGKKWEETLKTLQAYKKRYKDLQDDFTTLLNSPMKSMVLLDKQQFWQIPLMVDHDASNSLDGWSIRVTPMRTHPWYDANFKDRIQLDSAENADFLPRNSSPEPDPFRVPRTRENPWGNPWFEVHHLHPSTLVPDYAAKVAAARAALRAKDPKNIAYWEVDEEPTVKATASSSSTRPNVPSASPAATTSNTQQPTEPTSTTAPAQTARSLRAQTRAGHRDPSPATDGTNPTTRARSRSSSPEPFNRSRKRLAAKEKGKGKAADVVENNTAARAATSPSTTTAATKASASASGSRALSPKKDKGKGKAETASPGPSTFSSSAVAATAPVNNNNNRTNKITKSSSSKPAAAAQRATIKRSQVKKGKYWAFKAKQHLLAAAGFGTSTSGKKNDDDDDHDSDDTGRDADEGRHNDNSNKFFILTCPAPELLGVCLGDTPNFDRHPFKRNRAVEHFVECGVEVEGEEEIFARFAMEVVQDTARWPVNDEWARKHNQGLIGKRDRDGDVAMEDLK